MEPVRKVSGRVAVLDRADVDTDQIIPKQFLKRIERSGFGEFLFYDWRREGLELEAGCPILVTGRNFGCGSSREHAVWALEDFGFQAVVAPSFADIFYANCTKIGVLPVTLPEDDVRSLMEVDEAVVDLERQVVGFGGREGAREVPFEINSEVRERLLAGLDEIGLTLEHVDEIAEFERGRQEIGALTTKL
jgi:3-isopropylmalate/(R)-2-methylmalate dehydratase small subunit